MLGEVSPNLTSETLFPKRHGSLSCPAHEWSGIIFQFIVIRQCVIGEGEGGEPQSRFAVALGFLTAVAPSPDASVLNHTVLQQDDRQSSSMGVIDSI